MQDQDSVSLYPEDSDFMTEPEEDTAVLRRMPQCGVLSGCRRVGWSSPCPVVEAQEREEGELSASDGERTVQVSNINLPIHAGQPEICLLTDGVGSRMSAKDKYINVIHLITSEMSTLARFLRDGVITVAQRIVLIFMGLDVVDKITKAKIKKGVRDVVAAVRQQQPASRVGFISLVANFQQPFAPLGVKIVNYNRNVCTAVGLVSRSAPGVSYLPLHLHLQQQDVPSSGCLRFVTGRGVLTAVGALDLRLLILQECHLDVTPSE